MGYTTEFTGELKFTEELKTSELARLNSFLGEDTRDHPDWGTELDNYYIDLELLPDFSGLRWNGAEKTYNMVQIVNFIIGEMIKIKPSFGLKGKLHAQGEDIEDIWELVIEQGIAVKHELKPKGKKVECPHCGESFFIE